MSENYTMGEYWRNVSPILKQKNQEQREKHYDERIKYAITQFENNNIPYKKIHEKDLKEIERLNNIINELEKEIDRLLERQYESERFAKEQGFDTYLPAKENLLYVKNKLQELKGSDKE